MTNDYNSILAARISALRKEKGMTQDALAEKLGVTFQAVSKWENALSCPDITLLPLLADVFGISIDSLFGRETTAEFDFEWEDDDVIRAVAFRGTRLISNSDVFPGKERVVLHIDGDVGAVHSCYSVSCENVEGDVTVKSEGELAILSCENIEGNLTVVCGRVTCDNVEGDVHVSGKEPKCALACSDVEGDVLVVCASMSADNVEGDVHVSGNEGDAASLSCDDIEGDVTVVSASVACDHIGGDVCVSGEARSTKDVGVFVDCIRGDVVLKGGQIVADRIEGDVVMNAELPTALNVRSIEGSVERKNGE